MATDLSKQHILDADPRAMKQKKGTKNNTCLLFQKSHIRLLGHSMSDHQIIQENLT